MGRRARAGRRYGSIIACLGFLAAGCGSGTETTTAELEETDVAEPSDSAAQDENQGNGESAETTVATEAAETTTTTEPEPVLLPDMVGLTESEAQAAMRDLGLADAVVEYEESLEPAGIVLAQVPSAGTQASGSVSLVVSESIAPMPDFVGAPVADIRTWTQERGIDLLIETELTVDTPGGEIISHIPGAGGDAGAEVLVTIAETPVLLTLDELGTTDSDGYGTEDLEMNGVLYAQTSYMAVRLTGCCSGDETAFADFNLSRDWVTLTLTLGIDDREPIESTALVEFSLDGQVVREETVVFGATNEVEIDVADALRLRITVKGVAGTEVVWVGLGDAQLIGGSGTDG